MAGKRPYSHYDPGPSSDSKNKRPPFRRNNNHTSSNHANNGNTLPSDPVFRILCENDKIGGVIGKGGNIIKALRTETGARIKIEEPVAGAEERVIVISALEDGNTDDDGGNGGNAGGFTGNWNERWLEEYTQGSRDAGSVPAQMALFKVHTRILDALPQTPVDADDPRVITRMLVPENQVGCILGKRGRIIEQMREETGAHIRILPRDQLPLCALPSDELVQVQGDRPAVKRALLAISTRLMDNPPKDRIVNPVPSYRPEPRTYHEPAPPPPRFSRRQEEPSNETGVGIPFIRPTDPALSEFGLGRHPVPMDEELVFRVLCPNDMIGLIVGKNDRLLNQLREDTGAQIIVADVVPDSKERVIIVSSTESPDEDLNAAQEAVFHIQDMLRDRVRDPDYSCIRFLVPSNHVGCLLGKGGNIISEMRKQTRAHIRVHPKESLPPCALENDEIVQINGDIRLARHALVEITSRLRANLYREKTDNGRSDTDFGRYERSSSPVGYQSYSQAPAPRSPRSWARQNDRGIAGLASLAGSNNFGGLSSALGNIGASMVTTTRIEVIIPKDAIASVVGQNGGNLEQIRKLSGAKISMGEDYSGADRIIEISGTPDQTTSAKNLVDAFCSS